MLSLTLTRPVVLLAGEASRALIKRAAKAGVAAFLAEPLHSAQLAPTLDLAIARFGDTAALRRKLADRKVIERAKGQLMALTGLGEQEAFCWLRTRAMETRAGLGDAARAVLAAGVDERPSPTRGHLLLAPDRRFHSVPTGASAPTRPRRRAAAVR